MSVIIYRDDEANAIFIEDNNGVQFMNSLQATMDDPLDTLINIRNKSSDNYVFYQVSYDSFLDSLGAVYGATPVAVCNALNALFSTSGSSTGVAPVITSGTSVSITTGDTLNYELVATGGVGYEWAGLPTGVTTVEGNVRKLVGGSALTAGTYNITATAINYFGSDSEAITLTVSEPAFADTKSVNFSLSDYLAATPTALASVLGRIGNGAGSGDAWTIAFWYKPAAVAGGQTIFYFGATDSDNDGYIEVKQTNTTRIRLRYGSKNNYLQVQTAAGTLTSNAWNHVVVTYDGGTTGVSSGSLSAYYSRFSIFVDGVSITPVTSQKNYGWDGPIDALRFRIGRFNTASAYMQGARVDELPVYSADMSSDITALYNSGEALDLEAVAGVASPAHWWRMGDGDTYPTLEDSIGSTDFTMYNMTAADIVSDVP